MNFKTLLYIGFRNLLRQKRRNILLGLGVAIGMLLLVITGSFTKGLHNVVVEKWLVGMSGHIQISAIGPVSDFYGRGRSYFRDRSFVEGVIQKYTNEISYYFYDASAFVRLIGNKRSDLVQIVGSESGKDFFDFLKIIEGNTWDFTNTTKFENPIIMTIDKAKYLRVKLYDRVSASFQNLRGQVQTANFTIVALSKPDNSFMDWAAFVPLENMRKLLDFKPYEVGSITIVLNDIKKAIPISLEIREALKPKILGVNANLNNKNVLIAAYWRKGFEGFTNSIKINSLPETNLKKNGVLVSKKLADSLKLKIGDEITFSYKTRFVGEKKVKLKVNAIYESEGFLNEPILVNEKEFYKIFEDLPAKGVISSDFINDKKLNDFIGTEWVLLPRAKTSEEVTKIYEELKKNPIYADKIMITTLYESSSMFLNFLSAINIVSLIFASFLFLILWLGWLIL